MYTQLTLRVSKRLHFPLVQTTLDLEDQNGASSWAQQQRSAITSISLKRANCYVRMHSIDTASIFVFSWSRNSIFMDFSVLIEAVIEIPRTFGQNWESE